jgi:hypothetical protein
VLALGFLLLGKLEVERLALAALTLERGVAAAVERELAASRCRIQSTALSRRSRSWLMTSTVRG